MKRARSGMAAGVALAVLAAGVHSAAAPLPSPSKLAEIAFPGWSGSTKTHVRTVHLMRENRNGWDVDEQGAALALIEPKLVLQSAEDRLTLVAGLVPADADGRPAASHATPMALAAYQFHRGGDGWRLVSRQEGFDFQGFFGDATVRPVALSERRAGIAVESGSCWQGYCGTWLAVYEFRDGRAMPEPVLETALGGANINSAGDCARRLQPLVAAKNHDDHTDGDVPAGSHDCYAIEGRWSVARSEAEPGEVTLRFKGAMSRRDASAAPAAAIDERERFQYRGGKYEWVEGDNPVPAI